MDNLWIWLLGGFENRPLWKMMEWKSVGVLMIPNIWKVIKFMFQTTNQLKISAKFPGLESLEAPFTHYGCFWGAQKTHMFDSTTHVWQAIGKNLVQRLFASDSQFMTSMSSLGRSNAHISGVGDKAL